MRRTTPAFHRYTPYTLADLFTAYDRDILTDRAVATRYHHRRLCVRVLKDLGPLPLTSVTPEVLRAWKQRLSTHCGPGTIRKYMTMLGGILRVAVEEYEWLDVHPMSKVRKPPCPPGVVRFLAPAERVALLAACKASRHPHLYAIVLLALSTGGRKNECRTLFWDAVDLHVGTIRFLHTKNKRSRSVPIMGEILDVLREMHRHRSPLVPWVFPDKKGRRAILIEMAWRAARAASGVQNCRFHDLRHTFASYMALSGASLAVISVLLGHQNVKETMIYVHLLPSHNATLVATMHQQFLQQA